MQKSNRAESNNALLKVIMTGDVGSQQRKGENIFDRSLVIAGTCVLGMSKEQRGRREMYDAKSIEYLEYRVIIRMKGVWM